MRSDPLDSFRVLEASAALFGMDGVDHGLAADEILMRQEEEAAGGEDSERGAMLAKRQCVDSILQVVTAGTLTVLQIRDRVAVLAMLADADALGGVMGFFKGREGKERLRAARAAVVGVMWMEEAGRRLLGVITARGWSEREVGKRVLCLLYALQRDATLRPPMARSLETMGVAIGLPESTRNKRSAMSAAMKVIVGELMGNLSRRERPGDHGKLWFQKSEQCRRRLKGSMMGKRNRGKKGNQSGQECPRSTRGGADDSL